MPPTTDLLTRSASHDARSSAGRADQNLSGAANGPDAVGISVKDHGNPGPLRDPRVTPRAGDVVEGESAYVMGRLHRTVVRFRRDGWIRLTAPELDTDEVLFDSYPVGQPVYRFEYCYTLAAWRADTANNAVVVRA